MAPCLSIPHHPPATAASIPHRTEKTPKYPSPSGPRGAHPWAATQNRPKPPPARLRCFQRILRTLLNVADSEDTSSAPENNLLATQDDDAEYAEDAEAETRRVEQEANARNDAERMWRDAQQNYERLHDRLTKLCPTSENAKNVWPAAIYSLLSILATSKAAKRLMPELRFSPLTLDCCDGFLRRS